MSKLRIDPEFRTLIPPPTPEELAQLEANLKADGCRDPLVVWEGVLLDGHNRYEICQRLKLKFQTVEQPCADRDAALMWVIQNQLGRRNLQPFARVELARHLEPLIAARAKANQRVRKGNQRGATSQDSGTLATVIVEKAIAKSAGVSHDTVHKAKVISAEASEPVKAALRAGKDADGKKVTINSEYQKLRPKKEKPAPQTPGDRTAHLRSVLILHLESAEEAAREDDAFTFVRKPVKELLRTLRKDQ